jgi:glucose-6-phosphate isomerase
VVVTDPDSPLDRDARGQGLSVINADPHVGGRFSALSAFGLVPTALAGVDVSLLLDAASECKSKFLADGSSIVDVAWLLTTQT